jgi:glutaredoxin
VNQIFRPILYLKANCPHCFKARLFLTEAGMADRFDIQEFVPGDETESAIRAELAPHFAKATFPTVQVAPGEYLNESDDIIAHYAGIAGIDPATLPLTRMCRDVLLPRLRNLKRENQALRTQLDAHSDRLAETAA